MQAYGGPHRQFIFLGPAYGEGALGWGGGSGEKAGGAWMGASGALDLPATEAPSPQVPASPTPAPITKPAPQTHPDTLPQTQLLAPFPPSGTAKDHYGHFDLVIGKRAASEVWPHVAAHLEVHDAPLVSGVADLSPEEVEAEAAALDSA